MTNLQCQKDFSYCEARIGILGFHTSQALKDEIRQIARYYIKNQWQFFQMTFTKEWIKLKFRKTA